MTKKSLYLNATIFDRAAIGLFSGMCTVGFGSLIWFGLSWKYGNGAVLPFAPIVYSSIAMFVLGFALMENLVVRMLAIIVNAVLAVGRF